MKKNLVENQVHISNIVARSAQNLSLLEKRVLFLCLSKLYAKREKPLAGDHKSRTKRITAEEYATTFLNKDKPLRSNLKFSYSQLKKAKIGLETKLIKYKLETPKGMMEVSFPWVTKSVYHTGEGWLELTINHEISHHFFDLKKYTKYLIEQACELSSMYSWRLLELLTSMESQRNRGKSKVSLEDFRYSMQIPKSYTWTNIKQRVIEPAIEDLEEKDYWEIEWNAEKKGRSFDSITFEWKRVSV